MLWIMIRLIAWTLSFSFGLYLQLTFMKKKKKKKKHPAWTNDTIRYDIWLFLFLVHSIRFADHKAKFPLNETCVSDN